MKRLLIGIAVLAAALGGCAAYDTLNSGLENTDVGVVEAEEPSDPPEPSEEDRQFTDFSAEDYDGEVLTLGGLAEGRPAVVNLWASWCGPCGMEMPAFLAEEKACREEGVVFVMVNLTDGDSETKDTAKAFLDENGYDFDNVLYDASGEAAREYVRWGIPVTLMINENGEVVYYREGALDAKTLSEEIDALLGKEAAEVELSKRPVFHLPPRIESIREGHTRQGTGTAFPSGPYLY